MLGPRGRIAVFWSLIAAAVVFLFAVRGIAAPFLWALILAYLLNPVVKLVCRYLRVPRIVAVTIIYVALGSAIAWLWVTTSPLFLGQIQELGDALPGLMDQIVALLGSTDSIMLFGFEIDIQPLVADIGPAVNDLVTLATHRLLETAVEALEVVLHFLLTLVATFYLLIDLNRLGDFARTARYRSRFRTEFGPLAQRIDRIVVRFIYGELALVVIMSTVTYIALHDPRRALRPRAGHCYRFSSSLFPTFGPITAGGLAVLVSFGQTPPFGWSPVVYGSVIAFVYFVLRHAEGLFRDPQRRWPGGEAAPGTHHVRHFLRRRPRRNHGHDTRGPRCGDPCVSSCSLCGGKWSKPRSSKSAWHYPVAVVHEVASHLRKD